MSRVVLDASALLALLYQEPGGEAVRDHLPGSLLSAVNLSEVVTKSVDMGMTLRKATLRCRGSRMRSWRLTRSTRPWRHPCGRRRGSSRLSLGDRGVPGVRAITKRCCRC